MAKSDDIVWRLEKHCCGVCWSRIVSRPIEKDGASGRIYRCAGCGAEKAGHTPAVICACGFKFKGKVKLGLKCEENPQRSPEFPQEIVARQD